MNLVELIVLVVLVAGGVWAVARFHLQGEDLSAFDGPSGERFSRGAAPGPEIQAVIASLGGVRKLLAGVPMRQRTAVLRKYMDDIFADRVLDASFTAVDAGGVPAEWVLAPGADPSRRLLYIHGGAFIMGSPRSHRTLTSQFSALTGGAVLAIDYRLMPEHRRRAGIEDCRSAYRWMLDHGPMGDAPALAVFVAGDSAGGNLTLVTLQRARDAGLPMPAAAVCLSPAVDFSLSGRSVVVNEEADPVFTVKLLRWFGELYLSEPELYMTPGVSPLVGDFTGLPPLLFQVGTKEMLLDDSTRAAAKAHAAGVSVQLDVFDRMPHVFQALPQYAETRIADANLFEFLARHAGWVGRYAA
jgi:acetyl esterase/lipase